MNLNKVFIIGNLTRDPELRSLPSGQAVVSFGVATNRYWTKDGQRQEQAEFHNVVAFAKTAEIIAQYLRRGSLIMVEGRLQTRSWEGKDGVKRSRTEIVLEGMQFGPKGQGRQPAPTESSGKETPPPPKAEELETIQYPPDEEINPDQIPF